MVVNIAKICIVEKRLLPVFQLQMRSQMSAATSTPIYDYPSNATLTRTTWFDQWSNAIKLEYNAKVKIAMKRTNMRNNIIELLQEAINVRDDYYKS